MQEIIYNLDQHVRDWYAQIVTGLGKFEGETRATKLAYECMLNGFQYDDFGDIVDGCGYYCRVLFDEAPFIVCFWEDSQGFVRELTNEAYEQAFQDYVEACE